MRLRRACESALRDPRVTTLLLSEKQASDGADGRLGCCQPGAVSKGVPVPCVMPVRRSWARTIQFIPHLHLLV